jgi:hypothetical protein
MAGFQYSARDLYPNLSAVMNTAEITAPELSEQVVYTKGSDSDYPEMITTKDRNHIIGAAVVVIAILFAFGLAQ